MRKVISGMQIGVDRIAVETAKRLGFETGGLMPKGFKALDGLHPEFAEMYGIREMGKAGYRDRTIANVLEADATVVIAEHLSPGSGSTLTINTARSSGRPNMLILWPKKEDGHEGSNLA